MNKIGLLCIVTLLISRDVRAQANAADFGNKTAWETAKAYTKTLVDKGISPVYCSPLPEGSFNVYLKGSNITNLTLLRGMSIGLLTLTKTAVSDLSPLQGLPIKELHIGETSVTDLSPLKGLPLVRLAFDPYKITKGINVLRGMQTLSTITFKSKSSGADVKLLARHFWARLDAGDIENPLSDES